MTGWAIVAIPQDSDPVWKYSSEKIPHMTLLFLGEQKEDSDLVRITDFVAHVASTAMHPFMMTTERRGGLGPDDADVLFFNKDRHGKAVPDAARNFLLTDPGILKAYNSVEQYPEWTPHLTMGYPMFPAKKDEREHPDFNWVYFDRIALWTGEYSGAEFRLEHPITEEVDMVMEEKVEAFFEHHGVMGMKWGKRKAQDSSTVSGSKAPKKQKLTRKEVRQEKDKFYQDKATNLLTTASKKGNDVLLKVNDGTGIPTIVTGKEFVEHLTKGGYFNVKTADIYATLDKEQGGYVLNDKPTERFVRSDKKK